MWPGWLRTLAGKLATLRICEWGLHSLLLLSSLEMVSSKPVPQPQERSLLDVRFAYAAFQQRLCDFMGSLPRLLRLGYRAIFTVLAASPRSQALWSNVRRLAGVVGSVVLGGLGLDSVWGPGFRAGRQTGEGRRDRLPRRGPLPRLSAPGRPASWRTPPSARVFLRCPLPARRTTTQAATAGRVREEGGR